MFKPKAIMMLDSYKISHANMFPKGMTEGYSNFTPRSFTHFNNNLPSNLQTETMVWFGIQGLLNEMKEIWQTTFFDIEWDILEAEIKETYAPFSGPNGVATEHLKKLHTLGYLPLSIKALPEGSRVCKGIPVFTIKNTHPDFAWLPNMLETYLSCELWKMSTSATMVGVYRKIVDRWYAFTGAYQGLKNVVVHDFSLRGMSGITDAAKSGAGHLLGSIGTDNLPAVQYINEYYRGKETLVGVSVPASEHSVMCCGGKDTELETYRKLIAAYPSGIVSIVSDTWNFWDVVGGPNSIAAQLKDEILNRIPDSMGLAKVVFRPDSGNPVDVICGYEVIGHYMTKDEYYSAWDGRCRELIGGSFAVEIDGKFYVAGDHDMSRVGYGKQLSRFEVMGAVQCLDEIFGSDVNELGYKTINQRVGLIYGDSITPERANEIYSRLCKKGYAADNIVFGVGSFSLQYRTRDSLGFAMKMTNAVIDGIDTQIFKDPITDNGTKKSAKGLLCVEKNEEDGSFYLIDQVSREKEATGYLKEVFIDGDILTNESYAEIRNRLGYVVS